MFGNIFRIPKDQKQRLSKKENVEIDSPASRESQMKYKKYVSFLCIFH
jgi:hypothetical protein